MKRCPKCNRTYPSNTQRFCTNDGGMLVAVDATPAAPVPETVADPDAPTKVISRELIPDPSKFDPFKTVIGGPPPPDQTSEMHGRDTGELPRPAVPPTSPPTSAPLPPPVSQPISQQIGEVTSPSMRSAPPVSSPLPPPGETHQAPPPPPAQPTSGSLSPAGSGPMPTIAFSGPIAAPQFTGSQQPQPVQHLAGPRPVEEKSKLPLVLGILVVLLVLAMTGLGAAYVFVVKPRLEKRQAVATPTESPGPQVAEATPNVNETPVQQEAAPTPAENAPPPFSPPANAVQFVNSNENLDGKLAEHYVDFSFYYPDNWKKDPKSGVAGASNFAKVERRLPPDFTQENFAVGWYSSSGSLQTDQSLFHSLVESFGSQFEKNFPEYRKVSEGATRVGVYDGYEFRFEGLSRNTAKGDLKLWGRVVFLPPADGGKNGVTLLMLATSLAPELEGISDVGEKGELPMVLESFRFGRSASQ